MIAYFGPCQMKRKGKDREEPSKQQSNELRKRSTQSHQAYFYLMKAQITDNWYAYPIISFSPKTHRYVKKRDLILFFFLFYLNH